MDVLKVRKRLKDNRFVRGWMFVPLLISLSLFLWTRNVFMGVAAVLCLVLMAGLQTNIRQDEWGLELEDFRQQFGKRR